MVMEGFLRIRLPPWIRRLSTRLVAVVPAAVVAGAIMSFCNHRLLWLCVSAERSYKLLPLLGAMPGFQRLPNIVTHIHDWTSLTLGSMQG